MPPSKKVTIHTCTNIRIHTHTRTYAQQLDKCLGLWRPAEPNALITPHAGHAFPHTSWGRASARRPKCFNKPTSDDPTPTCPCTTTRQMSGAVAARIIKHVMLFVNSGRIIIAALLKYTGDKTLHHHIKSSNRAVAECQTWLILSPLHDTSRSECHGM